MHPLLRLATVPPLGPPVLVVDDEDTVRHLLSLVVGRAGGNADLADTGAAALALLAERQYDCALIDKNLPDGNGLELMRLIRDRSPRTQCLIVTGYGNLDSAIEALRLGAFDYIVKPFDVAAVTHRIKQALERQRLARELEQATAELKRLNARLAESRAEVKRSYLETVLLLSRAAEHRVPAAGDHVGRVSRYAGILARALSGTDEYVEAMVYAAPLHDIGNVGVPESILIKPAALTDQERAAVREHVAIGAQILAGATTGVLELAREIVVSHHERWDGSGYPRGLHRDEVPLSGRVVAVADAWDAMSSDRSYRRALPEAQALTELRAGAGIAYDPAVVEAFFDSLDQIRAARGVDRGAPAQ